MNVRRTVMALAGAAIAALAAPSMAYASSHTSTSFLHKSNNWAGYVALPKLGGSVTNFKDSQAVFTVPALDCTVTPNALVYHFAGIGGWSEVPYQAAGVVEGCSGTTPYYFGAIWTYQGYPYYNEAGPQNALAVSAGDTLSVSVFYNAAKNWVVFKVADLTTGTYYQQPLSNVNESYYPSAEVVTYGNIANQGTADFGHVGFSQISVLGTLQHQRVSMADPAFKVIRVEQKGPVTGLADVLPGVLASTATESSFANAWLRAN